MAVHANAPVEAIRIFFALSCLALGAGALLYLWLWVTVALDTPTTQTKGRDGIGQRLVGVPADRAAQTARNQLAMAGVVTLLIAALLSVVTTSGLVHWRVLLAGVLLIVGLALIWVRASGSRDLRTPAGFMSVLGGAVLVFVAMVMLVLGNDSPIQMLQGGLLGATMVASVALALLPVALRANRDLTASRVQQVRDAERAEIAAHLHDSVLQTLTLIRAAANDPARVRALALTQERELRSWLYTGCQEAANSLAEALREAVGQIESTYGVPIDVVTVGDMTPGPAELALIAAASEATSNAVRHGAPPVSVYLEVSSRATEAFIKDAGPGFDISDIGPDRHGVKGSIIGRMNRVGGQAHIRRLTTGTEVHLQLARNTAPAQPSGTTRPAPASTIPTQGEAKR